MLDGGIQLVAVTGTINAIVSLAIAWRIYISYQKLKSAAQEYFMKFYLHFGIFYLAFATSKLLFIDASGAIRPICILEAGVPRMDESGYGRICCSCRRAGLFSFYRTRHSK